MKGLQLRDQNSFYRAQRFKESIQETSETNLHKKKADSKARVNYSIQQLIQEQQKKQLRPVPTKPIKRQQKTDPRKRQSVEPRARANNILPRKGQHDTTFHYPSRKVNNMSFEKSYHPHDVSEEFHHYLDIHDEFSNHQSNMSFKDHADPNWVSKPSLAERHNEYLTVQKSDKHFDRQNIRGDYEVMEGKKLFSEGKTEEAKIKFEQALESNQGHPEARYLLGVCYLSAGNFATAIEHLNTLIELKPLYKKNVYILSAIALKKENDLQGALKILTKAISRFPKYYDAYIYRGKLLLRMKAWDRALLDFECAVKIQQRKSIAFIGQAEALRFLGKEDAAIECYTQAIHCNDSMKRAAIMKRAVLFIETQKYQNALNDINQMLADDGGNSEALYFKGFIQSKQGNLQDALLSFEQAIKHNNSKKAVTKALYEIAKIKIEQRDYYAAFHQLCRADYLDVDQKSLEKFRIFTDGVTFLMKRKYKEGVDHLTNLINNFAVSSFLKPLLYSYRAYGYICLAKHGKALADLLTIEKLGPLEKASAYNKFICEGVQGAAQNQFESALSYFLKAQKLLPNKMEPYFYRASTLIRFCNKLIQQDDEKRTQYLNDALRYFNKAVELADSNSNLLFYRGILLFCLSKNDEALIDLEKAIDKSEDNVPKHFYVRGLVQACSKSYKQALNDFSIAINLDEKLAEAYLNRAKVFQIMGDRNSAFYDMQKFIQLKPSEAAIHIVAGNMMFHIGAYDDAIKVYSNIAITSKNAREVLYLRAKCYIILKELNNALMDLEKIQEHNSDPIAQIDYMVLGTLKTTSTTSTLEGYIEGINVIAQALKKELDGDVFKKSDMLFYKAIYLCYIGDYKKAKIHIKESYDLKEKEQQTGTQQSAQKGDNNLSQLLDNSFVEQDGRLETKTKLLEDFEFFDRTYNVYEYLYNLAVIELMLNQRTAAIELITTILESIPEEYKEPLSKLFLFIQGEKMESCEIVPFPVHNRLCSIFPGLKVKIGQTTLDCKLSFCLPSIDMPSMNCCFDHKLLDISPTVVENRPEAPWIKRSSEGVIFTDNIQHIEDLDLMSEKRDTASKDEVDDKDDLNLDGEIFPDENPSDSQKQFEQHVDKATKPKHFDYSILDHSQFQIDNSKDEIDEKYDPQALKQQLMLDSNIAKKLEQILKKKKP